MLRCAIGSWATVTRLAWGSRSPSKTLTRTSAAKINKLREVMDREVEAAVLVAELLS